MKKRWIRFIVVTGFVFQAGKTIAAATGTPTPEISDAISRVDAIKAIVSIILFVGLLLIYMLYMNAKARKQTGATHYMPTRGRSGALQHGNEGKASTPKNDHAYRICPFCSAENPLGNHFCGKCGSML